ncbi:hypothetical protein AMAG_01997 [Allomyces macrogynus ATCC 38327]|uniref:UspA domain-containing protein n=1 Tax=Allomyces macrogynus (strain ATCC 38327) TaxID=578462 RepID=A0A0L0S0L4_ALLM3|nr:hypothetical protein AMAG_01997 [Allomyces macrogynus ATCC 38327]|eukprot:KNE56162.1 hypothetical protein AMAG_01997 [Allomyces macrogynus ATCC 38327]
MADRSDLELIVYDANPHPAALETPDDADEALPGELTPHAHRTILIAVDASHFSRDTVAWAVQSILAPTDRALIVHALRGVWHSDDPALAAHIDEVAKLQVDRARDIVSQLAQLVAEAGIAVQGLVLKTTAELNARDALVECAVAHKVDAVVVGSHGDSADAPGYKWLSRYLLGSTAEYLMRQAPMPVVVVRSDTAPPRPKDVTLEGDVDVEVFADVV